MKDYVKSEDVVKWANEYLIQLPAETREKAKRELYELCEIVSWRQKYIRGLMKTK